MSDNRMNLKKLCLMGLDDGTDIDIIREFCSGYGTILDFYRVKSRPELAFVEYANEEEAKEAKIGMAAKGYRVNYAFWREQDSSNSKNNNNNNNDDDNSPCRTMAVVRREEPTVAAAVAKSTDLSDTYPDSSEEECFVTKRAHSACTLCGEKAYLTCGRCCAFYCSDDCQRVDWLRHKSLCFPMPKLQPAPLLKNLSRSNTNLSKPEPIDAVDGVVAPMRKVKPSAEPPVASARQHASPSTAPPKRSPRGTALARMAAQPAHSAPPSPVTVSEPSMHDSREITIARMAAKQADASPPPPPPPPAIASPDLPKQSPREIAVAEIAAAQEVGGHADPPEPLEAAMVRPFMPAIGEPLEVAVVEPVKSVRRQPVPAEEEIASDGSRSPQPQHSPTTARFLKAMRCRTPSDHSLPEDFDALVRSKDLVIITEVVSHYSVYVQPVACGEELQRVHTGVYEAIVRAPSLSVYPKCGEIVAAPFEGEYYRGRVISVNATTDMVRISYVDYGNTDEVQFDQLKALPAELQAHRRLSMRVSLSGIPVDIDGDEVEAVKRQLILHQEIQYQLIASPEKVEMNAHVVLMNPIDELSLNEAMLEHCTERIMEDELKRTIIADGRDVDLIVCDLDDIANGKIRCVRAKDKDKAAQLDDAVQEHGKKVQNAPAYVPKPHELCLYRETVGKTTKWHRAVFEQAMAKDVCQIIDVDAMEQKRKIPMNDVRAYNRALSTHVYTMLCKLRGCGRVSLEELLERFAGNRHILAKTIEYKEARGAHGIEWDI